VLFALNFLNNNTITKMNDWDLYDGQGNRKYLIPEEREKYFDAIPEALNREQRTFALMLYYTGCRISEALAVQHSRIDYSRQGVVFQTLKRKKKVFRFVPLPSTYLEKLDDVHHVQDMQKDKASENDKIWDFGRTTGWTAITKVMNEAKIKGIHAVPKGLRHSFVIHHQGLGTPDHIIQRWMGWASRDMMEIYGRAVGEEERNLASKLWKK